MDSRYAPARGIAPLDATERAEQRWEAVAEAPVPAAPPVAPKAQAVPALDTALPSRLRAVDEGEVSQRLEQHLAQTQRRVIDLLREVGEAEEADDDAEHAGARPARSRGPWRAARATPGPVVTTTLASVAQPARELVTMLEELDREPAAVDAHPAPAPTPATVVVPSPAANANAQAGASAGANGVAVASRRDTPGLASNTEARSRGAAGTRPVKALEASATAEQHLKRHRVRTERRALRLSLGIALVAGLAAFVFALFARSELNSLQIGVSPSAWRWQGNGDAAVGNAVWRVPPSNDVDTVTTRR
ncbi:MAG TPA: hypothetical protein VFR90_10720 [Methylibium sp.]|uniref:hypothetical protein n=1 Tax=Methylibium sp. TaxID=2067992 RepID=UPI002DB97D3A|nr:hypothetical protein [Methylibium sp.]HEU4459586.1 hypothetical protein [Methylibium sp.]